MTDVQAYCVPEVFSQAHARGFGGFRLAPNPETLTDPATGRAIEPAAYSHSTILKRRAPGANKQASRAEIEEWKARAERVLVVLLRRDPHSPFERLPYTDEALAVLEEGQFTVQPGAGPPEDWGKLSNEPWYNPYLLRPDREFERRMFASYPEKHGARYVIYNTGAAVCAPEFGVKKAVEDLAPEDYRSFIEKTARRMLRLLDDVRPAG